MDCPMDGEAAVQPESSLVSTGTSDISAPGGDLELDGEYWRRELAVRLQRYRSRRKSREPRYPSLSLPFDSADSWRPAGPPTRVHAGISGRVASALAADPDFPPEPDVQEQVSPEVLSSPGAVVTTEAPDPHSNLIEFPRSAVVPLFPENELADPVPDRPRIVEAPEVLPPPPALGGILIESAVKSTTENTSQSPISAATIPRRMLAGTVDFLVLTVAQVTFAAMFVWVNPSLGQPWPLLIAGCAITWVLFWAAYKFLFLVYTGSTPGMRVMRLGLATFEGAAASRSLRRWRVLASYLSALSLGLGYLWSALDEDGLCWHDRMTRTHLL